MLSSSDNKEIFLGIDGGGSKCKAIVMSGDNKILGTGIAGPANPLHGYEQAINSIAESAKLALKDAEIDESELGHIVAGVGLAGVNLPALFKQMSNWQHPFKKMYLTTDLLVACLGAHNGKDGAVIITGTGSCGFSYVEGHSYIVGAHGFPHGDKGSGAWFGLQAAKQSLLSLDGLIPPSSINDKILALLKVKDDVELVEVIAGKPAAFYARMANLVFDSAEEGDKLALAIVNEGAEYISHVAKQLLKQHPPEISLIGGLTPRIKPWLDIDLQAKLIEPLYPPEVGSIIFAKQQLALQ
ncbi:MULTISPECIES: N-acetylglucosamine kinase [unclassified Colwellia]|jgi:glucosamine kinase|uniref:N-acetylglucosamine kinase n=1 Tax=unclassified Colwellia TaxID=196834 RepID=UPI0015F4892A|nr:MULTISPECIES: BadF/BadG/BcrA/BcrD ATPase family protein [unclassified Colwellia]MBA6230605.1 ATPase [Colwellia sp. MB02u-7]MBA6234536.1 ATPase [Colwellia sp. MB02u-11]MBA6255400.1 ATPase [Colwellia sp. MB3u-28]MBA6261540.1 ATPase [Colwellia sp. MB3u-41]MBA6301090.1 ATPase [Colwellia sp. MB3u-22]